MRAAFYESDITPPLGCYMTGHGFERIAKNVYPGEMFSEYAVRTRENSPFKYTMVVENSNAYGGYIAPPFAYSENSLLYETSPAYDSFVAKDGGEMLYNKLMEFAKELS